MRGPGCYRAPAGISAVEQNQVMAAQRALFARRLFEQHFNPSCHLSQHRFSRKLRVRFLSERSVDSSDTEPPIPEYKGPENETFERKRARLLYQSRKRGMLENGLLLSTFADKYLDCLSESLLDDYDKLINQPSNDWEIYYWMTEKKVTPEEYNSKIMDMLKNHAKNKDMEERIRQPDLKEK